MGLLKLGKWNNPLATKITNYTLGMEKPTGAPGIANLPKFNLDQRWQAWQQGAHPQLMDAMRNNLAALGSRGLGSVGGSANAGRGQINQNYANAAGQAYGGLKQQEYNAGVQNWGAKTQAELQNYGITQDQQSQYLQNLMAPFGTFAGLQIPKSAGEIQDLIGRMGVPEWIGEVGGIQESIGQAIKQAAMMAAGMPLGAAGAGMAAAAPVQLGVGPSSLSSQMFGTGGGGVQLGTSPSSWASQYFNPTGGW